ncbi:type II secretion system F family protein [Streptomonospora litoralis]|uniref:Bacterial type II secretion system protein F domain protein n=1 Tax=Streptomonospora litoralis TaxID=2498135 RepID=A0A4P6PV89_9ACTN|nr:type II secretion system F family protein [Streptomonospora litoralis]QBI51983.1 Bacterial type II secretion system protein F domain protein [Streptomonospora litoralis]
MPTPAPTATTALLHVFGLGSLLVPLHWLTGQAGWLLGFGAVGGIAATLVPRPAIVRLAELRGAQPATDVGLDEPRWREVLARRLRERLGTVTGRVQARRRRAVVELCRVLATELRAGRDPGAAVETAVAELDPESVNEFAPLRAAAGSAQDVVPPLRALAAVRGAGGLGHLAACWQVAATTGAPPADVVDRLAASLAAEESQRRELGAQLAGPRATAVMLSVLPVLGLAMAGALGGSPLAFLFVTPIGLLCLVAGLALDALGLFWTYQMVKRVLPDSETE